MTRKKKSAAVTTSRSKDLLGIEFDRGYVCAVANIISAHGEDVIARDVLRANMPRNWNDIDAYDRNILKKAGLIPNTAMRLEEGAKADDE